MYTYISDKTNITSVHFRNRKKWGDDANKNKQTQFQCKRKCNKRDIVTEEHCVEDIIYAYIIHNFLCVYIVYTVVTIHSVSHIIVARSSTSRLMSV